MLKWRLKNTNGRVFEEECPLCVNITQEEDVPADSVSALFLYKDFGELEGFEIFSEGELVFRGVIDEEEKTVSKDGVFLRISGRSMAAYLLDNESVPVTYDHPSSGLIYDRHAKKYGITLSSSSDKTYFSELVVTKGESQWQAVARFCRLCLASVPRVSALGELNLEGLQSTGRILFSDREGDVLYHSVNERIRRCEEISRVHIKVTNSGDYHNTIENPDAVKRGIVRERYLNAVLTETPMRFADSMIMSGRKKSYRITLTASGRHLGLLGMSAAVDDSVIGKKEDLYVSGLYYRLSDKEEKTVFVLKRRDS